MSRAPQEFRNWLGNVRCVARRFRPRSRDELAETLAREARRGPVRVLGRGSAWSPLVATDGALVDTTALARVLDFDPHARTVRVEAGITVRALSEWLAARGFVLPGATMYRDVTVGGALATGSHGADRRSGLFADAARALTLVDARGDVHAIDGRDPATLAAARVSLGLLGAVADVTLAVEPARAVWVDEHRVELDAVLAGLDDLLATYDCVQVFWFPQARHASVKGMRFVDAPAPPRARLARLGREAEGLCLYGLGSTVHPAVARVAPRLIGPLMRAADRINGRSGSWLAHPLDEFHYRERVPPAWSMSFAVPLAHAPAAWAATREAARRRAREHGDGPTFPVYARFTGGSDALLAGSHGTGATCWLESVLSAGTRAPETYFAPLERELRAIPGARQHWAKVVSAPASVEGRFAGLAAFRAARARFDPDGALLNPFTARALGLAPAAA